MQTTAEDYEPHERDHSPPLLEAIPQPVVEAMSLVMETARDAAKTELAGDLEKLEQDRAAFETERAQLNAALAEAQAAIAAEKSAHQASLKGSQSLRMAALEHDEIVDRLTRERDQLAQRNAELEGQIARMTELALQADKAQLRLDSEHKRLAAELAQSQQMLSEAQQRRDQTAERLKKAQLEIYTLKAQEGDRVSELKRLQRQAGIAGSNDTSPSD